MSYRRFNLAEIEYEAATPATTATVSTLPARSVADVANVAGADRRFGAESVANVAGVADPIHHSEEPSDAEVAAAEWEERAAILEYDESLSRTEAERLAAEQIRHRDDFTAAESLARKPAVKGLSASTEAEKPSVGSPALRPARWLPEPSPGVRILRPAVEVGAAEYDVVIAALPVSSDERARLVFARRKGWCVERNGERIFTRGRT